MVNFDVPGTGQSVSTDNPGKIPWVIVSLIGGFAVLFMALPIGQQVANKINTLLSNVTGSQVGDGDLGIGVGGGGL